MNLSQFLLAAVLVASAGFANTNGSLANLTGPVANEPVEASEITVLGGRARKPRTVVQVADATVERAGAAVKITFAKSGGYVDVFAPRLGLPADWRRQDRLLAEVEPVGEPVAVELRVYTGTGSLAGTLQGRQVAVDLFDLVAISRGSEVVAPVAVRLTAQWEGGGTRSVLWQSVALREGDAEFVKRPRFDKFVQRIRAQWPGKVTDEAAWRAALQAERETLAQDPGPPQRNQYGGWTGGASFKATGFFRTTKDDAGRWWLVDPAGKPFWSVGLNGVRTLLKSSVAIAGRESLYAELPDRQGPYATAYTRTNDVSFYHWNVLRRYGGLPAWRDHQFERFRVLGLNTLACWSEPILWEPVKRVPYVVYLTPKSEGAKPLAGHKAPDVWDASYAAGLERHFAKELAPYRDDPWLLGYFLGNEPKHEMLDLPWPAEPKEKDEYLAKYLNQMFRVIRAAMRQHDPNHLYLGCRWAGDPASPARQVDVPAMGEFMDVVSVNIYSPKPSREWLALYSKLAGDKPVMITEHHQPLGTPKKADPPYPVFTAEYRRANTERFIENLAAMPFAVGFHWYLFADDGMAGLVDVTDQPAPDLWEALKTGALQMYRWHAAAK